MQWPSSRVAPGGIYQPAKVTYSPETKKFLQELMRESKLSTMHRNKVNYSLRSGDPLPVLYRSESKRKSSKTPEMIVKTGTNARRHLNSIVESGAYEVERFVPKQKGVDREYAKKHLQDFMAYGKELKDAPKPKRREVEEGEIVNRFDELKKEIQERVDWLNDMEELGEGHKYKVIIEQQIAARIREMEKLKLTD